MNVKDLLKDLDPKTLIDIREMINELLPDKLVLGPKYSIKDIILKCVCDHTNLSINQLRSKRKTRDYVEARQIAYHLLKTETNLTFKSLGLVFNQDHSTVLYACKQVPRLVIGDNKFRIKFEAINRDYRRNIKNLEL